MTTSVSHKPAWWVPIRRHLLTGLLIWVPIWVTFIVLRFLFIVIDNTSQPLIRRLAGAPVPGTGFLLTALVLYITGLLAENLLGRRLISAAERLLTNIPIVKTIYSASKQVVDALSLPGQASFKRVVLLEYPRTGVWVIGFVTGESLGPDGQKMANVFVPTTPNPTTGFLLLLPPAQVRDANLTVEDGVKMVISGGLMTPATLQPSKPGIP